MTDEKRKLPGWLKFLLEFGPVLAFFIGYVKLKDMTFTLAGQDYSGFLVVTAAFIPLMVICTGLLWLLTDKLSQMQVMTVVLVVVFGGLSVWLQDERFFKMKPSIIYMLFAAILGFGLMRGQSYLSGVMGDALPMRPEGWMILTRRMALFFVALALANEAVWRLTDTDTWVNFKTFGLPLAMMGFFLAQGGLLKAHGIDRDEG